MASKYLLCNEDNALCEYTLGSSYCANTGRYSIIDTKHWIRGEGFFHAGHACNIHAKALLQVMQDGENLEGDDR